MEYTHVIVGGTFDALHRGHEALLARAFAVGNHVTIGITSDAYCAAHKPSVVHAYSVRKDAVMAFLTAHGYATRASLVPLDTPFEPAASDASYDAIVVSSETRVRAEEINRMREQKGIPLLSILEVPLVPSFDGMPISSSRIRRGEVTRDGDKMLPESLRPSLAKPLGTLLSGEQITMSLHSHKDRIIVTVGDKTTYTAVSEGIIPSLAIIDGKVERHPFTDLDAWVSQHFVQSVTSGPGFIAQEAVAAVVLWAKDPKSPVVLQVTGEDDLLAIPAVLEAPLGSIVYYGQPKGDLGEGVVCIEVTKEKKQEVQALYRQFLQRDTL